MDFGGFDCFWQYILYFIFAHAVCGAGIGLTELQAHVRVLLVGLRWQVPRPLQSMGHSKVLRVVMKLHSP